MCIFFDGVAFEPIPHAIKRVLGDPRSSKCHRSHNFSIELAWMIGADRGCLTLFLFLRGDSALSVVRISDGGVSYDTHDPTELLALPDVRVYAACWRDSQMLPGSAYQLYAQGEVPPLALAREGVPWRICCPVWPSERCSFDEAIVRAIEFPSYFLTGCGFDDEIAVAAMIAFQRSDRVDTIVEKSVKTAPSPDRFRAACLAYSNFTGFVLALVRLLESIDGSVPGPEFGTALANLFGLMPARHRALTHATISLAANCYRSFPESCSPARTAVLSSLALVLGAKQCAAIAGIEPGENLTRWARAMPSHIFAMQMADAPLSPQRAVRTVREVLGARAGLIRVLPGGPVELADIYRDWLEQTYLEPSIRF